MTRVFKFGGTSVADADRIAGVAALVAAEQEPVVVVVSALAGVTDLLVALTDALARGEDGEASLIGLADRHRRIAAALGTDDAHVERVLAGLRHPATRGLPEAERADTVRAAGEDLSAPLVAAAIRAAGRDARVIDARTVIRTDAAFGRAVPDENAIRALAAERLRPGLDQGIVPVVQGFVGATGDGRTTTLGRGGSDYTATLLGAALDADEVHIWTDVDGILTGDPRAVDTPRILEVLGFEEAVELAYFGAKVLHPGAAKHAVSRGLTVRIRNSFAPGGSGTVIARERWGPPVIAAVAFKPGVALIKVRSHPQAMPYGFLARVFEVLARHALPVDLVATSHTSTAFTLDATAEIGEVARELGAFADVEVHTGSATITVVGHGLLDEPGINARVFDAVGRTPIQLISQASDVSLSLVVAETDAPELVRRLHTALIDERGHTA
jgi:aspartate kinase